MDPWHPNETITRLAPFVRALVAAIADGPARTSSALRRSICQGTPSDPNLAAYVEKVRNSSYRVAPSEIDALRASGFDDDAIFEITVAAALGEALRRLRIVLRVLGRAD
jgi:alkylhydroperoxidase family enzyme